MLSPQCLYKSVLLLYSGLQRVPVGDLVLDIDPNLGILPLQCADLK